MTILIGILLASLVLLAASLQRAYAHIPVKELKRRAREGDETARLLHHAAVYGASLRAILWTVVAVTAAGFFVFTARHWSPLSALFISAILIIASFVWLPSHEVKRLNLWFAVTLAPALGWLLQFVHAPINKVIGFVRKHHPVRVHTGMYGKDDLLELLNSQNLQADNRIEQQELELAFHALTFGDKLVADYLTPRRAVKNVSKDDSIGPVLMNELHSSGFSRFPVYEGKEDHMVGTLFLKDLVTMQGTARVDSVMRRQVCYVHEDQSLYDALQAIMKTRHHLLIVVNSFEEYVGVISIEDVLEQIIGNTIVDEFDQYEDLRAVAARAAKKEHAKHHTTPKASDVETEVVE